jgi:hypothetical protein
MLKAALWAAVNSMVGGNRALPPACCRGGSSASGTIVSGFGEGTKVANNPPARSDLCAGRSATGAPARHPKLAGNIKK